MLIQSLCLRIIRDKERVRNFWVFRLRNIQNRSEAIQAFAEMIPKSFELSSSQGVALLAHRIRLLLC